jgi:4-amino-4-deoxy-L-arabinose transferase-like glycosyltransferase
MGHGAGYPRHVESAIPQTATMETATVESAPVESATAAPEDASPGRSAAATPDTEGGPWAETVPWLVVLFALFAWLGRVDLLTPDEARHTEIAREMFLNGNWLTPRIYGEPYYDKPALFYWLTGASLWAFGPTAWAARLPSVAGALFSIGMTSWWVRKAWNPGAARWVTTLMGSTLFFVAVGRYVVIDMLLTASLTGALSWLGIVLADPPGTKRRVWPIHVCMAVGALAKGPVAIVVVAGVAVVAALFERRPRLLLRLHPFRGALILLALAGPWYAAAYHADPAYIRTFLWEHNFARYAVPGALAHQQPWYFYLIALPVVLLPWSITLPAALARAWHTPSAGVRHALAWTTVVIGFFSFSQTKIPTYVLAAFPPLLAMAAAYINELLTQRVATPRAIEFAATGWTMLAAAIAIGGAVWLVIESPSSWMRMLLAAPAVMIALATWRSAHDPKILFTAVTGSSLALVVMVYGAAADAVNARESQLPAARLVREYLPGHAVISSYRVAPHALAFYAARPVRRAEDPESAVPELVAGAEAALLTRTKFLPELGLEPLPPWMTIAWTSSDGSVLVLGGSAAENLKKGLAEWRRREGVEPSADR